jgi:SprT protein
MQNQEAITSYKKILIDFIPEKAVDTVAYWIVHFKFNLKISESRSSKLGDYRSPHKNGVHQITVNHNLNKYSFFITLVHEIAHLVTFEQFNGKFRNVKPHGAEWKRNFKNLIWNFLNEDIFPPEVLYALKNYMNNPAASSCSDADLQRVLKRYDKNQSKQLLEDLQHEAIFNINGRVFKKGKLLRKRFECMEVATNRKYLVSGIAEVKELQNV